MTDENPTSPNEAANASLMDAAFTAFTKEVPDWYSMPATAIFMFLEDHAYEARDWAFKAHSRKHAQEWSTRVAQYQDNFPGIKEKLGIDEAPTVEEELGRVVAHMLGSAVALTALALDARNEDGTVNVDDVWTDEFVASGDYEKLTAWGAQSITWIVLKMQELVEELRPVILAYEQEECSGEEVANKTMVLLVMANALLFILMVDQMDEESREQLAAAFQTPTRGSAN